MNTQMRNQNDEKNFLAGPRTRWREFVYTIKVMLQFIKGFRVFHFIGPSVTIYGSARFPETHPYYNLTMRIAEKLAHLGYNIITGGGPGLMEAANKGAKKAINGGLSIGCNIVLPHEQQSNPYLDHEVSIDYFFVRKELLRKYSFAFVVMPGGMGTLDEFFETITLIQTKKIHPMPIVIMDTKYHAELISVLHKMRDERTIDKTDLDLFLCTDDVELAVQHIYNFAQHGQLPKLGKKIKSYALLGERKIPALLTAEKHRKRRRNV